MSPATPEHAFHISENPVSKQAHLPPGLTIRSEQQTIAWWLRDKEQGRRHFFLCPCADPEGRPDEQVVLIAANVDRNNRTPTYFSSSDGQRFGQLKPQRNYRVPWQWLDHMDNPRGQITSNTNPALSVSRTLSYLIPIPLPLPSPPKTYSLDLPGIAAEVSLNAGPYQHRRLMLEIQKADTDQHVALSMAIACALLTLRTTQ